MRERRMTNILALCAGILFVLFALFSQKQPLKEACRITSLNEGWTCRYGETEQKVSLPVSLDVPPGTEMVFTNTLPDTFYSDYGILFRSRMQRAEVFLDGERIYQYPAGDMAGGILPSIWNFVKLPDGSGGKVLEIRISSPYAGFSGGMQEVKLGNYNELIGETVRGQLPVFLLSVILLLSGAAMVLIAVVFRKYFSNEYQKTLGLLFIFVSLWLCGESRMPLQIPGPEGQYYITLGSLLLCPVFIFAYLYARWKELQGGLTRFLLYVSAGCAVLLTGLQLGGVCDFPQMLPVIHVLLALALGRMAWIYVCAARRRTVYRSELFCVFLILASAFAEIVFFYRMRYALVGLYVRISLLICALNFLRLCILAVFRKFRENYELERELRYSRLELMNSQIRPHFIYNSLNSIRALIRIDPEAASRAVYDFSTYLRANLSSLREEDQIPFGQELKNIQAYLNIERLRLGERLQVEYEIESRDFPVPYLSIQPLVENAVKHGIWKKKGTGTVRILEREREKEHVIHILDDGAGFDLRQQKQEETGHIGLKNIQFRIRELAGGTMEILSEPGGGTRVTVRIPKGEEKNESDRCG